MKFRPFRMIYGPIFRSRWDLSHCTLRVWLSQPIHGKNHQYIRVDWIPNDIFWRKCGQKLVKFCPFGVIYRPKFRSRCDLRHCTLRIRLSQGDHIKNRQNVRVNCIQKNIFSIFRFLVFSDGFRFLLLIFRFLFFWILKFCFPEEAPNIPKSSQRFWKTSIPCRRAK